MKTPQKNLHHRPDQTNLGLVLLAFLLLATGWAISAPRTSTQADLRSVSPKQSEYIPTQKDLLKKINLQMQAAERQRELNELSVEAENRELNPNGWRDLSLSPSIESQNINTFESENSAYKVYRDLHPNDRRFDNPALPADRINTMLEQDQWAVNYERNQRDDFVRRFKDSARQSGYEIEVDSQYRVKSIQRIPNQALPSAAR